MYGLPVLIPVFSWPVSVQYKYSQNTIQAANGILALSEEELQKSPVRFLVSGWAFYPDALLTPEEYGMKAIICATFPSESRPISPALQTLLPMAAGLIR